MSPKASAKLSPLPPKVPKLSDSIIASGSCGVVKSYAANSHIGLVRQANEDRVSINYQVSQPSYKVAATWPLISYFGVFDGHGGSLCADYLRDNLLEHILMQSNFPSHPVNAIKAGFASAERAFLSSVETSSGVQDRSGSCANVVLIIKDTCYVANVGDSRAVLSCEKGLKLHELSQDHKPNLPSERERIEKVGGKVYHNEIPSTPSLYAGGQDAASVIYRVHPGRLAISRAFGDADAKLESLGGIPGVVIAEPDVKSFKLSRKYDFILMASDGIFDKLSNSNVVRTIWNVFNSPSMSSLTFQLACGEGVKAVLEESLARNSLDNVTAVLIVFKSTRDAFEEMTQQR
jgi:protein phosphatase 2C family protein 2/3